MSIKVVNLEECGTISAQGFQRIHIFNEYNIKSNNIALEYVILPKGAESTPHAHIDTHTVVFTLKGSVRIYFGDQLQYQVVVPTSGCVYIPPNEIHYVVNECEEDMIAIVARTPSFNAVIDRSDLLALVQSSTL